MTFRLRSLALAIALGANAFAAPTVVHADDVDDLCIAASLEGQVLRRNGRLEKSRARFADCAIPACVHAGTRDKCAEWERQVAPSIPKITVTVVDDRGAALPRAEVLLDGAFTHQSAQISVDPGRHGVRASYAGRSASREIDVATSEQLAVKIVIDLRRTVVERPTPPWVFALGATSVLATGSFALFGNLTLARERALDACKPYCDPGEKSKLTTYAVLADVSLGVAAAAALATVITYLVRPDRAREERVTAEGTSSP